MLVLLEVLWYVPYYQPHSNLISNVLPVHIAPRAACFCKATMGYCIDMRLQDYVHDLCSPSWIFQCENSDLRNALSTFKPPAYPFDQGHIPDPSGRLHKPLQDERLTEFRNIKSKLLHVLSFHERQPRSFFDLITEILQVGIGKKSMPEETMEAGEQLKSLAGSK